MNRTISRLLLFCAISFFAPLTASAVTINTVPVGNAGNAADPLVATDGTSGYGSVPYTYAIGKYEGGRACAWFRWLALVAVLLI